MCLLKQMVHLPLHLSAIRCNYLSQHGQLQRLKSIPQCRSARAGVVWSTALFSSLLFVLIWSGQSALHLVSQYALLIQVVTTWLVCMSSCFCLLCTENPFYSYFFFFFFLFFFFFCTQQTTCQLMSMSEIGFYKRNSVLWFSNTATQTLLVHIFLRLLKGHSACSAYSVINMKKARLYLLLMFISSG